MGLLGGDVKGDMQGIVVGKVVRYVAAKLVAIFGRRDIVTCDKKVADVPRGDLVGTITSRVAC